MVSRASLGLPSSAATCSAVSVMGTMCSMRNLHRTRFSTAALFVVAALFLTACSGKFLGGDSVPPPPVQPKFTGLPATVPDYVLNSDASVIKRDETDTVLRMTMETINGISSPIAYYKKTLPEKNWAIDSDSTSDNGGSIVASKEGKKMSLNFKVVNGTSRIEIELQK